MIPSVIIFVIDSAKLVFITLYKIIMSKIKRFEMNGIEHTH